jgi:hypothetical protein
MAVSSSLRDGLAFEALTDPPLDHGTAVRVHQGADLVGTHRQEFFY